MASENQKSFLSQVTLDTSKINKQSLSTSILPPLHTGQTSYIAYKHKVSSRHQSRPLPFGSTSSRVTEQLQPKISSHIVSYGSSHSHFKQYAENPCSPFGSSENRFKDISNRAPGPGLYRCEEVNSIKSSNGSWKFSKMDRELSNDKNGESSVGPGSYQVEQASKTIKFRQKIAEKYREQRKKYVEMLSHPSNKPQHQQSFSFTDQKPSQLNSSLQKGKIKPKPQANNQCSFLNRFALKDSTKKYVMKEKQNGIHFCDQSSIINKNFTYNFIQKSDNAFASYIPKSNDSPGPGYYTQKPHPGAVNESFNFKSSSVRALFPAGNAPLKKEKAKLSQLL